MIYQEFRLAKGPGGSPEEPEETLLTLTYSWTISNPLFAAIEKGIMGSSMMGDNVVALAKLEELVYNEVSV